MIAEYIEYKGKPVLSIKDEELKYYPLRFGLKKARVILRHIEDIEIFVNEMETKQEIKADDQNDNLTDV